MKIKVMLTSIPEITVVKYGFVVRVVKNYLIKLQKGDTTPVTMAGTQKDEGIIIITMTLMNMIHGMVVVMDFLLVSAMSS